MTKLTEMKGASLLPVRKEVGGLDTEYNHEAKGFNSAVTQLEQCSVEVEIENMAKAIFEDKFGSGYWDILPIKQKDEYYRIAKALSKCKQNWLRLERNV